MAGEKITVGNAEVISLTDLTMQFPWPVFFPSVDVKEIDEYRDLYPECYGAVGYATDAGAYAIRSQGKTVIVDTGLGQGPFAMFGGIRGNLIGEMKAKGVPPESVDIVVHTHLHMDHVGWNVTDGQPTFPNARYYGPQEDYDLFSANVAANPQMAQVLPLIESGRFELFSGEISLTPEITTLPTPGHTPGHVSVLLSSAGEQAIITGDVAHHPMQLDRTDWSPAFDVDPKAAAATRDKFVRRLEDQGLLAAFCHFPGHGFGHVVRKDGRRVFRAL